MRRKDREVTCPEETIDILARCDTVRINEGIDIGLDRGRKLAKAETEARARDMLRDRMEISLVEKYTHLSMPRIQELARGLGML